MSDSAPSVAFDQNAPAAERNEAQAELQKAGVTNALSSLIPRDDLLPVIDYIRDGYGEQSDMLKGKIIPFPGKKARQGERGPLSVTLDEWQVQTQGEYWERPSLLGFDSLRMMVEQTPVLNAVIMTRTRQVQRFCRVAEKNTDAPGFEIRHLDKNHKLSPEESDSIELLNRFMMNCGWEFNPRARKRLRRDTFSQFMAKAVRDTLTMDSLAIETEWKRKRELGIDGFYAIDGSTIRLCHEAGYEGDDEIFAVQVVQGRVETAYSVDDLIYEPRNPRSDVNACGYGLSETELLVRVVTGFLNAMTYNIKGFDNNAIPRGMLHLTGNYSEGDLAAFKRYWNGMVKGVNNAWTLPVMVSKDQESKASFENFGIEYNEMYFSKWMTFLTSIICAIYGMSPAEINFDSFTGGNTSALAGSDTVEKLAASKESGLRPLLSYFENLATDFLIGEFSDKFVFRWTGLDPQDQQQKFEIRKLTQTVDEARAQEGQEPIGGLLGGAPLNPALMQVYMQENAPQPQEDFGTPPGQVAGDGSDQDPGGMGDPNEQERTVDEQAPEQQAADEQNQPPGQQPGNPAEPDPNATVVPDEDDGDDFGKSIPPVYVIE